MDNSKPTPVIRRGRSKTCPVCGKPSYSRDGVHPQCSVELAEMPRRQELAEEKKLQATTKKKPPQRSWNKKCPKCKTEVHVRLSVCACGHNFRV